MNLRSIPLAEMKADLAESLIDMRLARVALRLGIERTPRGSVPRDRIRGNANIIKTILTEIERRILAGELTNDAAGLIVERRSQ